MSAPYFQKPYIVGLKCLNFFPPACLLLYTKNIFLKYQYNQISSFLKNVLGTLMPKNKVPTVYDIYSPLHPAPPVPFPHCFSDPSPNIFGSQSLCLYHCLEGMTQKASSSLQFNSNVFSA